MRHLRVLLILAAFLVLSADAKKKKKFEGDFEFADEDESRLQGATEKKRWIYDPDNELCRPLSCKKKELCLLEDSYTALCVSKKDVHRNGDLIVPANSKKSDEVATSEDDDDTDDDVFYDGDDSTPAAERCETCPAARPSFLCGSDNRTYSSLCRLDYHNCLHRASVRLACRGFCPCSEGRGRRREKDNALSGRRVRGGGGGGAGGRRAQYRFTPQDLHLDNKHYKYIKYTKYSDDLAKKKHLEDSYNDVSEIDRHSGNSIEDIFNEDKDCAMDKMADRLLDWFSVLMADGATRPPPKSSGFPGDCKPEVRWMFAHLDTDGDGALSAANLYSLRHDEQERCLRPFLTACDGDGAGGVTRGEWCRCLQRANRPCAALSRPRSNRYPGAYVPACDARGFYRPLQCHPAVGVCWCVDPHGVERPGSRTKGTPHCPDSGATDTVMISDDEDSDAGSGDGDVNF